MWSIEAGDEILLNLGAVCLSKVSAYIIYNYMILCIIYNFVETFEAFKIIGSLTMAGI